MTDRTWHLMVTLDHEMRDDDVESVKDAIRMIRCVDSVEHVVETSASYMARASARADMRKQVMDALKTIMGWD